MERLKEKERWEKDGGGETRERTERWKEKGGRRGGSDVRDDGARSKVSQKSQMSLDLLARQLPETSGIPKMASVSFASLLHLRWQTSSLPAPPCVTETRGEDRNEGGREGGKERSSLIFISERCVGRSIGEGKGREGLSHASN